jgi:hypothetical protein
MTNQITKGIQFLASVTWVPYLRLQKPLLLAVCSATLFSAVSAKAITLTPPPAPDIFVSGIEIQYVGTALFARGLEIGGGNVFTLNADVTSAGFNSGTFEVGSLIKGDLESFSVDAGSTLEFYFKVTGGSLASLFGTRGGINLSGILPEFNGFTGDFDNTGGFGIDLLGPAGLGKAYADVGAVPDTGSTILLSLCAFFPLYLFRRKTQTLAVRS